MEPVEQQESYIEEEEIPQGQIQIGYIRPYADPPSQDFYKYATVAQVRSFERASEVYNKQIIQKRPLLFSQDNFIEPSDVHFISQKSRDYFKKEKIQENAPNVLEKTQDSVHLKIPVSNIKRQNTFILQVKNLKRKTPIQLQNIVVENQQELVRYKYIMTLSQINLCIKILVKLNQQFKVWKEIDVPLAENRFKLQIHEYNNEQTDIKVNDFHFHLILKMPFHDQTNYYFKHEGKCVVERVEFISKSEVKLAPVSESHCTKECQLI